MCRNCQIVIMWVSLQFCSLCKLCKDFHPWATICHFLLSHLQKALKFFIVYYWALTWEMITTVDCFHSLAMNWWAFTTPSPPFPLFFSSSLSSSIAWSSLRLHRLTSHIFQEINFLPGQTILGVVKFPIIILALYDGSGTLLLVKFGLSDLFLFLLFLFR